MSRKSFARGAGGCSLGGILRCLFAVLPATFPLTCPAQGQPAGELRTKPADGATEGRMARKKRELEVVMMQALLQPMFAVRQSGPFGGGSAGKHWQSMLSEHVARQLMADGRLRLLPGRGQQSAPKESGGRSSMSVASPTRCLSAACATYRPGGAWRTTVIREGGAQEARDGASSLAGSKSQQENR